MLRFRENKFALVEGSYYEDLHYSFFLTNSIFQKLVINMMGRSIHAIWVITLDPTCLMVCYAKQSSKEPAGGKGKPKSSEAYFVFETNLQAESYHHFLSCRWNSNSEDFPFFLWPMNVECELSLVVEAMFWNNMVRVVMVNSVTR